MNINEHHAAARHIDPSVVADDTVHHCGDRHLSRTILHWYNNEV